MQTSLACKLAHCVALEADELVALEVLQRQARVRSSSGDREDAERRRRDAGAAEPLHTLTPTTVSNPKDQSRELKSRQKADH
jgi:hypothetical protein